jgi:hypothetical protein
VTFPASALPAVTELLIDGVWTAATVREDSGVEITRGRATETGHTAPSQCNLTLDNRSAAYSNRLPTALYYGKIGRNTRLRNRIRWAYDTFDASASSSWGTTNDGYTWTNTGGVASNFNVTGGKGTHTQTTVNVLRSSEVTVASAADAVVTMSSGAVATGSSLSQRIATGSDSNNYYEAIVLWKTDSTVTVQINKRVAGVGSAVVSAVSVGSYVANTAYKVRVQRGSAQIIRCKMWLASGSEPDAWTLSGTDGSLSVFTDVLLMSRAESGNTNVNPVLSFDDFEVNSFRFCGEVPAWPQVWEVSGADVTAPIEAAGIMRRLGSNSRPLHSALNRAMIGLSEGDFVPIAYWPCEDGSDATQFASALPGQRAATVSGDFSPASYAGVAGSDPLPVLRDGQARFDLPSYTDTNIWQAQFTLMIPSSGFSANAALVIIEMLPGRATTQIVLSFIQATSALRVACFNSSGTLLDSNEITGYWERDTPYLCAITDYVLGGSRFVNLAIFATDGTNLTQIDTMPDGAATGVAGMPRQFIGYATSVSSGWSLGHVALYTADVLSSPSVGPNAQAAGGYAGELATDRMTRLCREEGITFDLIGETSSTAQMGPQRSGKLLDLLFECADVDQGILHEPRDMFGLAYRTSASLYNQTGLALDYAASQVFPPFAPTEDDQVIVNDATARRVNGSWSRVTTATGPLSIQDPPDGVGTYDEDRTYNVYTDSQLESLAGWRAHVGSWDEARFPQVHVMLHAPGFSANAALTGRAAATDVGDYLSVDNQPAWLPPELIELLVQGYRETQRTYEWDITHNCVPAGPYNTGLYDDARFDSDYTTTAEALDTTETGVDIVVATGKTGWPTTASNPSEFNFDIVIGGERMTVTASTSTGASTYTFTVIRSVNGVVKSHSTGAALHVENPGYYAY